MCHCAGGRGLGIDTATPDGAVYEYADYADYADTNTPITPTTLIKLMKLVKLIKLITDRRRARVCWAIVRCSATGLVLLGVTVCIIMHIMYSISSTHCDHTPSSSCALFSTDLAPLNRAFNPHNTQTLSTDLAPNLPKCAQNALECPLPQALPQALPRCSHSAHTTSAAPPRTAAAPARPRSPPRPWRRRRRIL